MKLLWVATKAPWPPVDGGRLVACTTLEALRARGHEIDLVAPSDPGAAGPDPSDSGGPWDRSREIRRTHLVPVRARSIVAAAVASLRSGDPIAIERHRHPAVEAAVAARLRAERYDVVHAEQVQALASCAPAFAAGVPVVLRCQNVESELWLGWARAGVARRAAARIEAGRLARFEGRAVRRVAKAIALTATDAAALSRLAGGAAVEHVPAPFPEWLPPGDALPPPRGRPDVAVLGSRGWEPNRDAVAWLVSDVWPRVRADLPGAVMHVYGAPPSLAVSPGVVAHAPPSDSRIAFSAGAIAVVPLRYGSGVRMRILEAWARGVPVVATADAARGLEVRDGREVLLASSAAEFVAALRRLDVDTAGGGARREALVAAGRARLRLDHDPAAVAGRLEGIYLAARS